MARLFMRYGFSFGDGFRLYNVGDLPGIGQGPIVLRNRLYLGDAVKFDSSALGVSFYI